MKNTYRWVKFCTNMTISKSKTKLILLFFSNNLQNRETSKETSSVYSAVMRTRGLRKRTRSRARSLRWRTRGDVYCRKAYAIAHEKVEKAYARRNSSRTRELLALQIFLRKLSRTQWFSSRTRWFFLLRCKLSPRKLSRTRWFSSRTLCVFFPCVCHEFFHVLSKTMRWTALV